jgi:hypothetical protein
MAGEQVGWAHVNPMYFPLVDLLDEMLRSMEPSKPIE